MVIFFSSFFGAVTTLVFIPASSNLSACSVICAWLHNADYARAGCDGTVNAAISHQRTFYFSYLCTGTHLADNNSGYFHARISNVDIFFISYGNSNGQWQKALPSATLYKDGKYTCPTCHKKFQGAQEMNTHADRWSKQVVASTGPVQRVLSGLGIISFHFGTTAAYERIARELYTGDLLSHCTYSEAIHLVSFYCVIYFFSNIILALPAVHNSVGLEK